MTEPEIDDDFQFTAQEMRTAHTVSRRITRTSRGLVEDEDVFAHLLMWMWEHRDKVDAWRDEDRGGLLNNVLYKKGLTYVDTERRLRTGCVRGDFTYYTPEMIKDVLPGLWDYQDWLPSPDMSAPRGASRPAEGNNVLAVLCDVSGAVSRLPESDRECLRAVYSDGGLSMEVVAILWELTESGARKRVDRIIGRIVDRLGGPPPWWTAERLVRSNAAAQAEVNSE